MPGQTFGPELDVHAEFDAPGIYQLWGQFRLADGDVLTGAVHRPSVLTTRTAGPRTRWRSGRPARAGESRLEVYPRQEGRR